MVKVYKKLVDDEVDFYSHDQGVAEVIGHKSQEIYDQIEDAVKNQLYNKDMYGYLLDVAKKEKDKDKAKEKVDKELKKLILDIEKEII